MESGSSKTVMTIVAVFAAVIIGGVGGYAIGMNKDEGTSQVASMQVADTATKAADLRTLLNNLETEHVDLASAATRAGFDGSPMFDAAAGSLDDNSVELADAIGSVYGSEARDRFLEIWRSHIGFFVDYTVAAKAGDAAGMNTAVENLNGYVEAISDFLSNANPNLPKEAVASLISEHVMLLKDTVDKHGAGDFAGSYASQAEARNQIQTKIADTLAGAIVKQNPEKFENQILIIGIAGGPARYTKLKENTLKNKNVLGIFLLIGAVVVIGSITIFAMRDSGNEAMTVSDTKSNMSDRGGAIHSENEVVETDKVSIENFDFQPHNIKVKVGTTVTWTNEDDARHDVTPDEVSDDFTGSELLEKGESYSFTFTKSGTYSYNCSPHPYMKGVVEVIE